MARRKKGGQRLIEMARKRRKSSSAKKTAVRPKRVKGGQKLSELAGITPASRKRAAQKRKQTRATKEDRPGGRFYKTPLKAKPKAKAKTAVIKRGGTTITYKPKPSPQLKPKVRKYTAKEKADYEKRYKETARKSDPAFTRTKPKPKPKAVVVPQPKPKPKPKATTKPVVKPPKGSMGPSYHRRKGKGHGFGSTKSSRVDLTKQQKTLVAEGKKLSKQFGLKIPAPSVRTAEKLGLPIELAGWVALAIATRGKTKGKVAGTWSKLKNVFNPKSKPYKPPTPATGYKGKLDVVHGKTAKEVEAIEKAARKADRLKKQAAANKKLQKELEALDKAARKRGGIK